MEDVACPSCKGTFDVIVQLMLWDIGGPIMTLERDLKDSLLSLVKFYESGDYKNEEVRSEEMRKNPAQHMIVVDDVDGPNGKIFWKGDDDEKM